MNRYFSALACWLPMSLALSGPASPQQSGLFKDPANLRGERVRATNGHELPVDQGARGLEQMLRRLNTRASILNIVAHPDDEDGGMLAFYSRGQGARVADLSLTRGEGGQNAVTGDFEDALGLLRTQELLSSDRYPGIDQFFGTEVDFGFSKTKEEAFGKWTHERVLYDVVRAIRLYRPLVLTSTWIGGVTDGHGQHQVAGQITQDAFKAAGDPNVFPELTREGIYPWQPLKAYARVPQGAITPKGLFDYATGQYTPVRFNNYITGEATAAPPSVDVVVHEGASDSLLTDPGASGIGESTTPEAHSYVQFARIGLSMQRSQIGPGVRMAPAGAFDVAYHLYGSRLDGNTHKGNGGTFFEGIDTSLMSLADLDPKAIPKDTLADLMRLVNTATHQFQPSHPESIAPLLASALKKVDFLITSVDSAKGDTPAEKASALHELRVKRVQLNQALTLSLGLRMSVSAPAADALIQTPLQAEARLEKTSELPVTIGRVYSLEAHHGTGMDSTLHRPGHGMVWVHAMLKGDAPYSFHDPCLLMGTATVTRPYFGRDGVEEPVYKLSDESLRNAPGTPPALTCIAELRYEGVPVTLAATATSAGQPVSLVPPMTVALSAHAQVVPGAQRVAQASATVVKDDKLTGGQLTLHTTNGWTAEPASAPAQPGTTALTLTPPLTPPSAGHPPSTKLSGVVRTSAGSFSESYRPVGYPGLLRTNFYVPAIDHIVPVEVNMPAGLRLAYLPGTGDAVAQSLASIGVKATELSVADLTPERLAQFDTLLLGVRAYAAHPDLHGVPTQAMLQFARNGGNVVVQYQTAEFSAADAPFPLTLGRDAEKVVDEGAGVQLLDPTSPLLSAPNRITTADFGSWIEERGHGFLRTWDGKYSAPTETQDPGQEPQRGGLISAALGKGRWTYVAFALYRQMPEAVPGSFRLMLNLIAPAQTLGN